MANRIQLGTGASEPYRHLLGLHKMVEKAAADAGLDQRLLELVKIRASMLNGCAFCLFPPGTDRDGARRCAYPLKVDISTDRPVAMNGGVRKRLASLQHHP